MPLIREPTLIRVCVCVGPSSGTSDAPVVLRLQYAPEDPDRVRIQELLGHEANLLVNIRIPC
jgi:hypothetical protein